MWSNGPSFGIGQPDTRRQPVSIVQRLLNAGPWSCLPPQM